MPHDRRISVASVTLALLLLAGCTPMQTVPAPGICNADAAQALVGQAKPTDADAMRLTGAMIVRQISPGDQVTDDWRENRVNIESKPTTGRVVRASCG